jgi:hypothetical protein
MTPIRVAVARLGLGALVAVALGCGPEPKLVPVEIADDPTFESPDASDDGTGVEIQVAEPDAGPLCLDDLCPEEAPPDDGGWVEDDGGTYEDDGGVVEEEDAGLPELDAGPGDAGTPDAGHADAGHLDAGHADAGHPDAGRGDAGTPPPGPVVGSAFIVRAYAAFRGSASATAPLITSAAPHGGVHDPEHGPGQPLGYLPQGQVVTLAALTPVNGYSHVRYDGKIGWIQSSRLAWVDPRVKPFDFANRPAVRNAFFKNQLHRAAWNKDGAYYSGTCAPTSLAMGARIFGKEPNGLSIEQSIHRSRLSYGVTSDHLGTNRFQIRQGAHALGLNVAPLDTLLSGPAMLSRIATQLALKRVVVLEGQPGLAGPASTYQQAFNRAYAQAGINTSYTFDGRHSIAVIGRETDGGYIVGDPISEVGMVTLTGAELKDFFARWGGTGNAVWVP